MLHKSCEQTLFYLFYLYSSQLIIVTPHMQKLDIIFFNKLNLLHSVTFVFSYTDVLAEMKQFL